MNSSSKLLIYK